MFNIPKKRITGLEGCKGCDVTVCGGSRYCYNQFYNEAIDDCTEALKGKIIIDEEGLEEKVRKVMKSFYSKYIMNLTTAELDGFPKAILKMLKQEVDDKCVLCNEKGVYEDNLCVDCYNIENDETMYDNEIQARLDLEAEIHNKEFEQEVVV